MGHKIVNGIEVSLTPEEEADFAEREKNYLKKVEDEKPFLYINNRLVLYNKRGATNEAMNVAMWEKIIENRPEESDRLQVIRLQVKIEVPKPIL